MTHYGLKEGYCKVNGHRAFLQMLLGKWHYFRLLVGWKELHDTDRVEKLEAT